MNVQKLRERYICRTAFLLVAILATAAIAAPGDHDRDVFVLTSTNNTSGNDVAIFKLDTSGTPSLSLADMLATGGKRRRKHERGNPSVQR